MLPVTAGDEHAYTVLLSFDDYDYELCLSSFITTLFYGIHFVISNKKEAECDQMTKEYSGINGKSQVE